MSLEQTIKQINHFRDERNWRPHHNAKDLAISISLEAAELLEDFQWVSAEEGIAKNLENIKEEIADVLIYTLMLSDNLGLDVETIIADKLKKNAIKYPVK
ncbi:nucleotide pyrophosphohydrolase [Enterococcus saccharolyticus]|uniref:nucleotide pyrophosphohydrolase n=1 Tax=Enterococcus saccharolyticus TaxID=41997 RepID=UPI001E33BED3|nr:nucleotide pyrophosphohydrolase [Enterococcus saccharolyticus]MCD5001385.1 nucleotide pyrophosphohydrolase [Enterococcus saccharolyticus]